MAALTIAPGDWQPSELTQSAGNAARTRYTNAPLASAVDIRYRGPTRTQLPIGRGTHMLRDHIAARFGIVQTYMPGRSRPMLPSQRLDMHQAGRAIDFMTRDRTKGDAICAYLIANADAMGLQYIVWNGNQYSAGQPSGRKFSAYPGSVKHRDHPHVELTPEGARGETSFYGSLVSNAPSDAQLHAAARGPGAPFFDAGNAVDIDGGVLLDTAIATVLVLIVGGGIILAAR